MMEREEEEGSVPRSLVDVSDLSEERKIKVKKNLSPESGGTEGATVLVTGEVRGV